MEETALSTVRLRGEMFCCKAVILEEFLGEGGVCLEVLELEEGSRGTFAAGAISCSALEGGEPTGVCSGYG